jgi:hypothetical protein
VGAAALVLAFGKYNVIFPAYARLPLVGLFRAPARFVVLVHFATSVLAALAFADLAGLAGRPDRPEGRVPGRWPCCRRRAWRSAWA